MSPRRRGPFLAAGLALAIAAPASGNDCGRQPGSDASAIRAVVVIAGEDDPAVARAIAALGANTIATQTPPRISTASAAAAAGLGYLPRLSTRDVDRLPYDPSSVAAIRSLPALSGIHYLDEEVLEGYASPATQARAYGVLKSLFPDLLVVYATRLDPIATDPSYLASSFRPEFTDLVTPYFYPVGTTVLGTQEQDDPWEARLRSLLAPLAARVPAGKPLLPVLQAFEQIGHPAGGGLPRRQLDVYREFWPDNPHLAAFWWGGETTEPLLGIAERPWLARGIRKLFGHAPSRSAPCAASPRGPLESAP
jgi:hypothetical protein